MIGCDRATAEPESPWLTRCGESRAEFRCYKLELESGFLGGMQQRRAGLMRKPRTGVRILEVGQFTYVPSAGAVFADWGATVP